jgi:hypothetical protein
VTFSPLIAAPLPEAEVSTPVVSLASSPTGDLAVVLGSRHLASELGVHPATVRDRLDQHRLPRSRATRRPYQAIQRQTASWAGKRQARLAGLGFADVEEYLRHCCMWRSAPLASSTWWPEHPG